MGLWGVQQVSFAALLLKRGFIRKPELKKGSSSQAQAASSSSGLSTVVVVVVDDVSGMYSGLFFVVAVVDRGSGAQKESVTGDVQEKMRVVVGAS